MDCTLITFKDGKKEIRYWIDPITNTRGIETYLYATVENEKIEEIKKASTEQVQKLLNNLF